MIKPNLVFSWNQFSEWRNLIWNSTLSEAQFSLERAIKDNIEKFRYVDDVAAFESFYSSFGDYPSLLDKFVKLFRNQFQFIKMYHCCRPTNINDYYTLGIRTISTSVLNKTFQDIFLHNPLLPQITEGLVQSAIEEVNNQSQEGRTVYLGIDDRFLVQYCDHYLKYGSEYLQCLVAHIERETGENFKFELSKYGYPTVFEARIPLAEFSDDLLRDLASEVFCTCAYNFAHDQAETHELDFSIGIQEGVSPEFIIRHFHPQTVS